VDNGSDSTSRGNRDITAVITSYNYGRYLPEAVESVLGQEGGAPRLVVVDDGSSDPETPTVLAGLPDDAEVVRQENLGVCRARNAGLERVKTPYAVVLDADDRLAPRALAAMREPLDAEPKLGFAYGRMRFFGDWEGELRFPPYDPYVLLYRHTIGLTALTRRGVFDDTGGFDPAFEQFEDWELWVNALAHGWRGRQVDAVTVEYRRHAGSKHTRDRGEYRSAFGRLREKHAALYRERGRLAADSDLGAVGRAFYRYFWGTRPVPPRLERSLHRLLWGRKDPRTVR
jgi:glycosyltransferase involved in cell wall biosynthesis